MLKKVLSYINRFETTEILKSENNDYNNHSEYELVDNNEPTVFININHDTIQEDYHDSHICLEYRQITKKCIDDIENIYINFNNSLIYKIIFPNNILFFYCVYCVCCV